MSWGLASPLMSSPDEPAHAMRAAAVVQGDLTGQLSIREPGTSEVLVPRYLAESMDLTCFRNMILTTAACQVPVTDQPNELVTGYTTATLNTPVFYAITGLPTLFLDGNKAMYAMRAMVALMCSALLAIAFMAIAQLPRRRWTLFSVAVAVTPMVLFLSGTINPNAVEVCAAVATLALMTLIFREDSSGSVLLERIALLALSVFLLVNTRSLSLFWLLIISVIALILARPAVLKAVFSRPTAWVGTAVMGTAVVFALWWFLTPKGLTQEFQSVGVGTPWLTAFITSLDRTFDLGYGWIGVFGWLDTPAPAFTLIVWIVASGTLVVGAFLFGSWRFRACLIVLATALVLLPALIQASLAAEWGYVWQGRYTLAIFVCLIVVSGLALDEGASPTWPSPLKRLPRLAIVMIAFAQLAAFLWALKRYVVGLSWDLTWIAMIGQPNWQPPFGWIAIACCFAAALAVGVIVLSKSLNTTDEGPAEDERLLVGPYHR